MNSTRKAALAGGLALAVSLGLGACTPNTPEGEVTLTLMFWGEADSPELWDEVTAAFIADGHENVTFEYIHQPTEYETKLQTLIAADDAPDVFLINDSNAARFADSGAVLDLAPHWDALGVDTADFVPASLYTSGDAIYGISPNLHATVLFYDKAAFEEAGIDEPPTDPEEAWTWDEFADAARELTIGEGIEARWGVSFIPGPAQFTPLVVSNGGSWWSDDLTEFTLNSPEAVEVFEDIHDLYADGSAISTDNYISIGWETLLQSRRVAMYVEGSWVTDAIVDAWGDDAGIALIPRYGEFRSEAFADRLLGSAATENPELAAEFIAFVASHPDSFPPALAGAPSAFEFLDGDQRDLWLDAADRPDGYAEVMSASLTNATANHASGIPAMPEIEFPIVWGEAIWAYLGPDATVTDIQAALDSIKPKIDEILQR